MVEHHTGAIEASRTELADGENDAARELAQRIAADQAAEIAVMERLLGQL
jgi:uncharacterized protein (DUF305 family)